MANEITVKVKGKDELSDVLDKTGDKAERTGNRFKGFGDQLGSAAKDKLEPFNDGLQKAGIDLDKMGTGGMVAGAAIAGLTAFVAGGIQKLDELVATTEQYRAAANLSYEEASKLGGAFKNLGIEAETGVDVIKTLAEEAGDAPEKFAQFNIEIGRTSDGSVDMIQTLKNVSDRFSSIRDPAERAALGMSIFGDSWIEIAPLIERGSDGIEDLLENVDKSRIVTEESARKQKEYQQSMRDLTGNVEDLQMALAQDLIPQLADTAENLAKVVEGVNDITESVGGLGNVIDVWRTFTEPAKLWDKALWPLRNTLDRLKDSQEDVNEATEEGADVMEDSTEAVDEQTTKLQEGADAADGAAGKITILKERQEDLKREVEDVTEALDDQRRATDDLYDSVTKIIDADLDYEEAQDRVADSLQDLDDKQRKVNDLIDAGAGDTRDAADAQEDYDDALRDALRAIDDAAKAEADKAQAQAISNGTVFTAQDYTNVYRDSLGKTRDQINDPNLREGLDILYGKVDAQATVAWKAQQQLSALESAARRLASVTVSGSIPGGVGIGTTSSGRIEGTLQRRATGGPVSAGTPYLVGEDGIELFVPDQSGTIVPNGQLGAAGGRSGGGGGGDTYYITVQALDGRGAAEAVTRALRDAKRYGLAN